jgi:hypothetical protein
MPTVLGALAGIVAAGGVASWYASDTGVGSVEIASDAQKSSDRPTEG